MDFLSRQHGVETVFMLPPIAEAENQESRSQAAGWICTDWERRQLMIAYQRVRFLPSSHSGEWASSAGISPQRRRLYWDSTFFNLARAGWEWANPSLWSSFPSKWSDGERQPRRHDDLRTHWTQQSSHYEFLFLYYEKNLNCDRQKNVWNCVCSRLWIGFGHYDFSTYIWGTLCNQWLI